MPDFGNWLGQNRLTIVDAAQRAAQAWQRIQDDPDSVVLDRDGASLAAQTVRITYGESVRDERGQVAMADIRTVIVYGVRNHPDSAVADTDIQREDRFVIGYDIYQVVDVVELPGEVQARAERIDV